MTQQRNGQLQNQYSYANTTFVSTVINKGRNKGRKKQKKNKTKWYNKTQFNNKSELILIK